MEFSGWFMQENSEDRNFTRSVYFTDKTTLSLESVVKVPSMLDRWFSKPYTTCTHASQCNFTLNVWAAVAGNILLGPYILTEKLDSCNYVALFQRVLPNMLNDASVSICRHNRFQHDGTTTQLSRQTRTRLLTIFLGLCVPTVWPCKWIHYYLL